MNPIPQATAVAYPISSIKSPTMDLTNDNSYFLEHSSFASDAIEASGNFFSQLDSMIAAVKVESSALDTMREKLKEVDNLRAQITAYNKRLIDADQSNLSLKSALMKAQESYSEVQKQKTEIESANVQLRQELNRAKDILGKEKAARQSAQQEIVNLREKVGRYEAMLENYEREAKSIPVLQESNEILKNDLLSVRRKYKEEKTQMVKHIRQLESQQTNAEGLKSEMRTMAMRLMDLANGTNISVQANSAVGGTFLSVGNSTRNPGMSNSFPSNNFSNINGGGSVASAIDLEVDDDDYDDDASYVAGDDSLLDDDCSVPDHGNFNVNSSNDSISKLSTRSSNNLQINRSLPSGQVHQQQQGAMSMPHSSSQDIVVKKRRKKASVGRQQPYQHGTSGNITLPRIA